MNYDEKCQLLIVGDSTVGKTSILSRYTSGTFNANYLATVGLDFFQKEEIFNGKTIRIKIWDTAGQERYKSLTQGFFRNAQGIMVVYDVTNMETFDNLQYWIKSIKTHVGSEKDQIPVIVIGNKIDATEREVERSSGEKFAADLNYDYFETSAKTGEGVEKCVNYLVEKVLKYQKSKEGDEYLKNNSIKLDEDDYKDKDKESEKGKKKCC